jgi:hypothetical protein
MNHLFKRFLCCEACGTLLTQGVHRDVRDCEEALCLIRDTLQAAFVHLALNDVRFRQDIDLRQTATKLGSSRGRPV